MSTSGKIPFDPKNSDLETVRQIVFERLRRDTAWTQVDQTGDGFAPYVEYAGQNHVDWINGRHKLIFMVQEVFGHLLTERILAPGFDAYNLSLPWFHITQFGQEVLASTDLKTTDSTGHLRSPRDSVANSDSCFISYSSKDQVFADLLYKDLLAEDVQCWIAREDLKIGDKFRSRIDESIRVHDKLLLILSQHAIASPWVEDEVEAALERERRESRLVLFPIRLDDTIMQTDVAWAAHLRQKRHIGDFRGWKDHDTYQKALERLVRDLETAASAEARKTKTVPDGAGGSKYDNVLLYGKAYARASFVEYFILWLVQKSARNYTPDLFETSLPSLLTELGQHLLEINRSEIVDALKRLQPKYVKVCKYVGGQHLEYPIQTSNAGINEEQVFYAGSMELWRTEFTELRLQDLATALPPDTTKRYGFQP